MPGSILRVAVDNTAPVAAGIDEAARRVLRQQPGVPSRARRRVEGHEGRSRGSTSPTPLRSGWAWGQNYLEGGAAGRRGELREGQGLPVRTGDHVPRAAARDVQVPVQRHLRPTSSRVSHRSVEGDEGRGCGGERHTDYVRCAVLASEISQSSSFPSPLTSIASAPSPRPPPPSPLRGSDTRARTP